MFSQFRFENLHPNSFSSSSGTSTVVDPSASGLLQFSIPGGSSAPAPSTTSSPTVHLLSGDKAVDTLILERFFLSGYKPNNDILDQLGKETPMVAIPTWLKGLLGESISLFRADGYMSVWGRSKLTNMFLPFLFQLGPPWGQNPFPLTWEVLARLELALSMPFLQRNDTVTALTPNGSVVFLISSEHLKEIARSTPPSILHRIAFVVPQPVSSLPGLPYWTGLHNGTRDEPRISNWFPTLWSYLRRPVIEELNKKAIAITSNEGEVGELVADQFNGTAVPGEVFDPSEGSRIMGDDRVEPEDGVTSVQERTANLKRKRRGEDDGRSSKGKARRLG